MSSQCVVYRDELPTIVYSENHALQLLGSCERFAALYVHMFNEMVHFQLRLDRLRRTPTSRLLFLTNSVSSSRHLVLPHVMALNCRSQTTCSSLNHNTHLQRRRMESTRRALLQHAMRGYPGGQLMHHRILPSKQSKSFGILSITRSTARFYNRICLLWKQQQLSPRTMPGLPPCLVGISAPATSQHQKHTCVASTIGWVDRPLGLLDLQQAPTLRFA